VTIQGIQVVGVTYDTFKDAQKTSAGGALRVNLGRPNTGSLWLIDRIWYRSGASTPILLRVYATASPTKIQPNDVIEFSPAVAENLADETQPPHVLDRENLIMDFSGGGAADLIHFRIDYRIGYLQAFQAPNAVVYPVMPGINVSPEVAKAQAQAGRALARIDWPGSPS
jgi:hypothetical protein